MRPSRRSDRRLIHDIPVIHRHDSEDSAWRDSEGRVTLHFRRPERAGRKRTEPLDGGLRETRRRSARIEAGDAAERAKQKKKREAQAEPTFFEIVRRETGAFGQTEPRRESAGACFSGDPRRICGEAAMTRRIYGQGTGRDREISEGTQGTDRGRKASAGTSPGTSSSPHRREIRIRAKWGPAAMPALIFFARRRARFFRRRHPPIPPPLCPYIQSVAGGGRAAARGAPLRRLYRGRP